MKIFTENIKNFFKRIYSKSEKREENRNLLQIDNFSLNSSDLYSTFLLAKNKYNYSFYKTNVYKATSQNLENIIQDAKLANIDIDNVLNPIYSLFSLSLLKNFNYLVSVSSYIAFLISNENSYNYNNVVNKVKDLMKENNDKLLLEYENSSNLSIFKDANIFILNNIKLLLSPLNPVNSDINNYSKVFDLYFKAKTLAFVLSNVNYINKDLYLYLDNFINECFDLIKPLKDNFKDFYVNNKQILDINFYRVFVDLLSSYFSIVYKTNQAEAPKLMKLAYNLSLARSLDPNLLDNSIINSDQENIIKNIIDNVPFDTSKLKKNISSNLATIYINSISSYLKDSIKNGQLVNGDSLGYLYLFILTSIMINYINNNKIDSNFNYMLSNLRNFMMNKPLFSSIFDNTFSNNKDQIASFLDTLNKISFRVFFSTFNSDLKFKDFYFRLALLTKISTKLNKADPNYQKYMNYIISKFLELFKLYPDTNYFYEKVFSKILSNTIYPRDIFFKSLDSVLNRVITSLGNSYDPSFLLNQVVFVSFLQNLENIPLNSNNSNNLNILKNKYSNLVVNNVSSDSNLRIILKDYYDYLKIFPENIVKDSLSDIIFSYYTSSLGFIKIVN